MQLVEFLLVFKDAGIGFTELGLVESLTETLACLLHLFGYLLLVFAYLVFDEHVSAVTFL